MLKPDHGERGLPRLIGRRGFFGASAPALAGLALWACRRSEFATAQAAPAEQGKLTRIVEFADSGARKGVVVVPKIVKSEEVWRRQLSPAAFEVTSVA
jgi:hypothetical protein